MKNIGTFLSANKFAIGSVLLLLVVLFAIWYAFKKPTVAGPTIVSDSGTTTQTDIDTANALAVRLKDDLGGINIGHDDTIYMQLAQSSNTVFALTFGKYRSLTAASLTADISSDYFYGWSVIDVILNRATALNLS